MTTALVACTLPAIGPAWAADQGQAPNIKSAQAAAAPSQNVPSQSAPAAAQQHLDIMEYRIEGSHLLPEIEVEKAVYPYLGPNRTTEDVEKARATLEKAYNAKGYQTVAVEIPPQHVTNGIVTLKVVEGKIGRLDVKGSRFFSLDEIKKEAPSLQPGTVPNFNQVQKDIVALNQQPDRKVTPALRAGRTPGTIDADLNVEDTFPLHGSVEINNRYSQNTTPLRLNASVHYDNLWQMGHSLSLSYQIAPENPTDAKVFSGSYLARIPSVPWLSFLVYGLTSDSNVATVGDVNVAGKGHMVGARAIATLPSEQGFFHNISIGLDYKHFDEDVSLSGADQSSPITYFPMTAAYSATWQDDKSTTVFDTSVTFHLRGLGSTPDTFDAKRFDARSDFIYLKSDISRTQELPEKLQGYVKLQGQVSNAPLVNSEQFSGGGQDTVRGYLESEVLGDNGILASTELRSPSLSHWFPRGVDEWRFYGFSEGGVLSIYDPLPEQQSFFGMASIGVGTRIRLVNHLNGSLDFALPLITQTATHSGDPRLDFRVWADF